jgi:polyisoprenoid-binding protein YceI
VLSPQLLDAETYPHLSFTSTGLVRADGQWALRGELEARGVSRLVEARISAVRTDGSTLHASARISIDRHDFGITAYRGLAARTLAVDLAITAHREDRS